MATYNFNSAAYGTRPVLPSAGASSSSALSSNLANLPKAISLVQGISPTYQKQLDVISGQLAGQLSPELVRQYQQSAAERGVATGMPLADATMTNYLSNRLFGAEALQQRGMNNALNLANLTNQIVSPYLASTALEQDVGSWNAIYRAAPDPAAAAAAAEAAVRRGMGAGYGSIPGSSYGGGGGLDLSALNYSPPASMYNPGMFGGFEPTPAPSDAYVSPAVTPYSADTLAGAAELPWSMWNDIATGLFPGAPTREQQINTLDFSGGYGGDIFPSSFAGGITAPDLTFDITPTETYAPYYEDLGALPSELAGLGAGDSLFYY